LEFIINPKPSTAAGTFGKDFQQTREASRSRSGTYKTTEMDELIDKIYEKRLLSSKKLWKELAFFLGLLLAGVKDSYLVDCCALKITTATEIVAKITNAIKKKCKNEFVNKVKLVFVLLDQDIVVMRDDVFTTKLKLLRDNDWTRHPFIVNIEGDEPILCTTIEMSHIAECLMLATSAINLDDIPGIININKNDCIVSTIGFVFVAGWLLSYPCIYYYNKHHNNEEKSVANTSIKVEKGREIEGACSCDNSLSMQVLRKYYITMRMPECARGQIHSLEFTIPKNIYDSDNFQRQRFEQVINEMIHSYKSNVEMIAAESKFIVTISDVNLRTEDVVMPAVML